MLYFLLTFCLCVNYKICFYDADQNVCPSDSEKYTLSQFNSLEKDFSDATELQAYIHTDISSIFFPLNKFSNANISFYGVDRKYSVKFNQDVTNFAKRIYCYDLIVLADSSTKFNKVAFIRTAVNQINPSNSNPEIDPLVANDLIIDTISLINVENIHAPVVDIQFPNFATSSQQTFYIIGDKSLKMSHVLDGSTISFYGDFIIFNKDQYYIYIITAYWYGSISIEQPNNTQVSLQYLMANMTLKDKVINYNLGSKSTLSLSECIWPTLDRVRLELTPSEESTVILSAINIPLFIKNTAKQMKIVTNSTSLFIPALNITSSEKLVISSLIQDLTSFTIGTIYCKSNRGNNIDLQDPNTILITQILGIDKAIFNGLGKGQYSLFQYPPTIMYMHISNLNTIYGSHTLVIPFTIDEKQKILEVDDLIGSLEIYPNVVGNPSLDKIREQNNNNIYIYSSRNSIENVIVNFNKRGLRGFTEGTNIYESYIGNDGSYNKIIIHQFRQIDKVNDKFCIALDRSFCPSELQATFVEKEWQNYADHEIAEMTFYVYNTTNFVLNFSKYDNPVVNFYGYNDAVVSITGESIEDSISYLVARNISFNVTGEIEPNLGFSADLENTHFYPDLEFVDDDTYNFISDYNSFPKSTEENYSIVASQLTSLNDFGMSQITLFDNNITLKLPDREVVLPYIYGQTIRFYFTEKSNYKQVDIIKGSDDIPYTIEISALPESARFKLHNFGDKILANPIIKFLTFGCDINLDGQHPPVSFYDLIDGAIIRFNSETVYMDHPFDTSAKITLESNNLLKKVKVVFKDPVLPDNLKWTAINVYVVVQNPTAVGGPSQFKQLHLDGKLTFNKGPALSATDFSTESNAEIRIPYSFNSMPQINFTAKEKLTIKSLIMEFVPPIDENVFIHRNIKYYEDSMFDILCGNFDCESVNMVYVSDIKYFNGDLCAFEKSCVSNPIHGQCLRIRFNSELDPVDPTATANPEEVINKKKTKITNIIIGVICGVVALVIIIVIIVFVYKRRQELPESLTANLMDANEKVNDI